jgi:2-dehydro-3-deoxygalactonokinase
VSQPAFIGGDWGTSRLRLFLCDAGGAVLARADGPGVAEAGAKAAEIFARLTAGWDKGLPAILSGMVGSTIGWREASYVPCPVAPDAIAQAGLRLESDGRRITIIPGLSCRSPIGTPDVMRGEETQILGALRLHPELRQGHHLLCLPGTHAKWAALQDGVVTNFQTALSGELYDLLSRHSVLARDSGPVGAESAAFRQGLDLAGTRAEAGLLHLLFSTRARQVTGEMAKGDAASYLSGLVIGADIWAAVAAPLSLYSAGRVHLICSPALATLYAKALTHYGLGAHVVDGDDAALAGLVFVHHALTGA